MGFRETEGGPGRGVVQWSGSSCAKEVSHIRRGVSIEKRTIPRSVSPWLMDRRDEEEAPGGLPYQGQCAPPGAWGPIPAGSLLSVEGYGTEPYPFGRDRQCEEGGGREREAGFHGRTSMVRFAGTEAYEGRGAGVAQVKTGGPAKDSRRKETGPACRGGPGCDTRLHELNQAVSR